MIYPRRHAGPPVYRDWLWRAKHEHVNYTKKIFRRAKFVEYATIFLLGACTYMMIEVAYRGYTHWTMGIVGGLALLIIGFFNEGALPAKWGLLPQGIVGSIVITAMELLVGLICNVWLGWEIWDYSNMPLNFMGQICLPFSLIWIGLAIVAIFVDDLLRHVIFNEEAPHYDLWYCHHTK